MLTSQGVQRKLEDLSPAQLGGCIAACTEALPLHQTWTVLYIDPPWRFSSSNKVQGVPRYPTMSLEQLKALPVGQLAHGACSVLYMWACSPLLDEAIQLGRHWGFSFVTVAHVWVKQTSAGKPVMAPGWWQRPCVELLLLFKKGKGHMKLKKSSSIPQLVCSKRGKHSQKPEAVRQLIEDFMYAPQGRLELFSRQQASLAGWACHGLEVPGYYKAARLLA